METVFARIGHLVRQLFRGMIYRLWVHPLETLLIPGPFVEKPSQFRSQLLKMSRWSANVGRVLLEDLRLTIIQWAGADWSVTYIGNGFSAEALSSILFPAPPDTLGSSTAYLWQVPGLVRKFSGEGNLIVCELNRIIHLSPKNVNLSFTTPQWIKQVLEGIDGPLDEVMASIHSTVRRRARKLANQGYNYVTTHSEADFDMFYHRMYVPYIATRHSGNGAIVRGYDYVHRYFENGILLLVKEGDELVSGSICQVAGDTCHWVLMGVMDGLFEHVKNGANVALFWLAIQWARDQGARRFDFGLCRPMVIDGVFNFKRQWGARVIHDREIYSQWKFFVKDIPTKLRDHLNGKGFISEISGEYYQVILPQPGQSVAESDLVAWNRKSEEYGLTGILTVSTGGKHCQFTSTIPPTHSVSLPSLENHPAAKPLTLETSG